MSLSFAPFVMLRTPLYPLSNASYPPQPSDPVFEEGVYLAAPAFWTELTKRPQRDDAKLEGTMHRYWIRSCMRCTPFGTFAGNALISLSDAPTRIVLEPPGRHRIYRRLDSACLSEIIAVLERSRTIRGQLRLYPNSSLYALPGRYRYAASRQGAAGKEYELTEIRSATYITATLNAAAHGATATALASLLCSREDVRPEEAAAFIEELLAAQVLVTGLEICLTGDSPLDVLIGQIGRMEGTEQVTTRLKQIRELLSRPGASTAHCREIESAVRSLDPVAAWPPDIIQADMYLSAPRSTISKPLISGIVRQVSELQPLLRAYPNQDLEAFRHRFYQRFDAEAVPLVRALDPEMGIGYGKSEDDPDGSSSPISDLPVEAYRQQGGARATDAVDQLVGDAFDRYLCSGEEEIVISESAIAALERPSIRLPASMYLMGSLLQSESAGEVDRHLFYASGFGGPSAGNLLGRFTHGDPELLQATRELLAAEEAADPDAIYAELVHLPQARSGNILFRPLLRSYEIPYIGKSGAAPEYQIPIDDLLLSIRNGELCLYSQRLGKRVIPRLSTAHDYSRGSLPLYQFLCDLQHQGYARPQLWDWGPFAGFRRLPRVRYKDLILYKASWVMEDADLEGLPDDSARHAAFFSALRERHRLPERVVVASRDHELLIDFRTEEGRALFLHYLRKHKRVVFREFLFSEEAGIVHNEAGEVFANELIIPIINQSEERKTQPRLLNETSDTRRKFPPGSEWLYVKVYCGSRTAEEILSGTILPFVEHGLKAKEFERFFFLRYRDDWNHLRLRFLHHDPSGRAALQEALQAVLRPALDGGLVHKISYDTYVRELERYGADLIEATESVFHNDSVSVLRLIRHLAEEEADANRLFVALRGIDAMLDDFGLRGAAKRDLLRRTSDAFFREFGAAPALRKSLNEKYRQQRPMIFSLLDPANDGENGFERTAEILNERSRANSRIIGGIREVLRDNGGDRLSALIGDLIHLFMNRLLIGNHRKYELLAYHFLEKYYASQLVLTPPSVPSRLSEIIM